MEKRDASKGPGLSAGPHASSSTIIVAFFGFFALSLIAAGIMGYLGCEETAIPNLLFRRTQPAVHT